MNSLYKFAKKWNKQSLPVSLNKYKINTMTQKDTNYKKNNVHIKQDTVLSVSGMTDDQLSRI